MKKNNSRKIAFGVSVVVVICLFLWGEYDRGFTIFSQTNVPQITTRELTMFYDRWTPTIELGVGTNKKILWAAVGDNIPFLIQINGGPINGGYEYFRPSRSDEEKPIWGPGHTNKWVPPDLMGKTINIRFKLADNKIPHAQLAVTIQPDN